MQNKGYYAVQGHHSRLSIEVGSLLLVMASFELIGERVMDLVFRLDVTAEALPAKID